MKLSLIIELAHFSSLFSLYRTVTSNIFKLKQ